MNGHGGRFRRFWRPAIAAILVCALLATGAVWTNTLGAGDRFDHLVTRIRLIVAPPPDRPIQETVEVTEPPDVAVATTLPAGSTQPGETAAPISSGEPETTPAAGTTPAPETTPAPGASIAPTPIPTPTPVRKPVNVKLKTNPDTMFASELQDTWCAVAGTQIVLAILGLARNSDGFQRTLAGRIGEWESRRDSHNGGWGPAAIASALDAYGAPGYQVRAYQTRASALRGAAVALSATNSPVVMMAWRGAHTWVITGYKADGDPAVFSDATITGAYVYDPWWGWITSLWDQALPPGAFHDGANLQRNFLPWARPEGNYPGRDGRFILVVPTIPRPAANN